MLRLSTICVQGSLYFCLLQTVIALVSLGSFAEASSYHSETVAPMSTTRIDATATRRSLSTEDSRRGAADIAQIVQREPDVRVRRSGGMNGPAYISIRGSDPEGVRYLLDGVPLHGAGMTTFNVNSILPELISSMDVYRTTVPIHFGNVSTGGVVDFRLKATRRDEVWASVGHGSFGSWKASVAANKRLEDGSLRVAGSFRRSLGNFRFYNTNGTDFNRRDDNPNDVRINNDSTQGSWMMIRDQNHEFWRTRVVSLTDVWEGGISGMDVAQSQHARGRRFQQNLTLNAQREFGRDERSHISLTSSIQMRRSDFKDRRGEVGTGSQERVDHQLLAFFASATRTELAEGLTLSSIFDLQLERDEPSDKISPHYVLKSGRIFPSAGLELKWEAPSDLVAISVGSRASIYHQRVDALDVPIAPPPTENDFSLTPQFGIMVQPVNGEHHRLRSALYFSRSHRQPGFDELFGDSGGTIGNADLTPETQSALELLGQWAFTKGSWSFDARAQFWFHWRDNAIEYFALPTGARKPFNIKGARVRGQELSLSMHHDNASVSLQAAHLFSENLSEDPQIRGSQLPWRSPWSFTADLRVRVLPAWMKPKLELISTFRFDDEFYAGQRNRRIYPSRVESDVGLEIHTGIANVPSIRLEAYNLFNRRVTTVPGRNGGRDVELIRPISDFNGQPRSGRAFYATLMWQLHRE